MALLVFPYTMAGSTINETIFVTEPLSPTLGCYISASNGVTQSTVYEGGDADPLCRNFSSESGIDTLEPSVDSMGTAFQWNIDEQGNVSGSLGAVSEFWLAAPLPMWEDATGILYETRLRVPPMSKTIPIVAQIPGAGRGQFWATSSTINWGHTIAPAFVSFSFPEFELGEEATIGFLTVSTRGGYLSHEYAAVSGSAYSDLILVRSPVSRGARSSRLLLNTEIPEPGTAFLFAGSIAGVLTRRWIRS
jgi:hypothetical protein